jgi:hypothetical protein
VARVKPCATAEHPHTHAMPDTPCVRPASYAQYMRGKHGRALAHCPIHNTYAYTLLLRPTRYTITLHHIHTITTHNSQHVHLNNTYTLHATHYGYNRSRKWSAKRLKKAISPTSVPTASSLRSRHHMSGVTSSHVPTQNTHFYSERLMGAETNRCTGVQRGASSTSGLFITPSSGAFASGLSVRVRVCVLVCACVRVCVCACVCVCLTRTSLLYCVQRTLTQRTLTCLELS